MPTAEKSEASQIPDFGRPQRSQRSQRAGLNCVAAGLLLSLGLTAWAQTTFDGIFERCTLPEEPYPHMVIGTIAAIATPEQTGSIFEQMHTGNGVRPA